jgi:flagellar basal-body rod protein FlgB
MDAVSTALISKALDGLHQRYLFTAQNIANAGTRDYRPVRVSFEEELRAAGHDLAAIASVEPRVHADETGGAVEPMRLDLELIEATRTSGRYRALVDILGRQMALHRMMISSGADS